MAPLSIETRKIGNVLVGGGRECIRDMRARAEAVCVLFQVQVGRNKEARASEASEGGRTIRSLKSDAVGGGGGGDRPTNIRKPGHQMRSVSFIPHA